MHLLRSPFIVMINIMKVFLLHPGQVCLTFVNLQTPGLEKIF